MGIDGVNDNVVIQNLLKSSVLQWLVCFRCDLCGSLSNSFPVFSVAIGQLLHTKPHTERDPGH